ncbi:EthD family reductase [Muricauda sp. SCSIO 64092]|uniref:EthD family reductase n=1 Tax=Allomuricauda sp. SCSIO 64092 TaxID=2908842 RepID=UPI001FF1A01D|nr:EthD family reductase [Muricauda sp. SCSIO 64092]UOY06111.1 EthD family reductase [Muricauda sp. SCSIO 64092]
MTTKIKFLSIILVFTAFASCKTGQLKHASAPEMGGFKVAILYPNEENVTFDMNYYQEKHMPMVAGFLGENLRFYEIDKGIAGRTPNDKAPFVAIGYFYVKNIAEYNEAIAKNREAIISDFKNYTNARPTLSISEIVQVQPNPVKGKD